MAQYIAKLNLFKSVQGWSDEGADLDIRDIDSWSGAAIADSIEGITQRISEFCDQYGLDFKDFSAFDEDGRDLTDEGRRFTTNRVEDNNGCADEHGAWLADYDLHIRLAQCVECPTFGRPQE